MSLFDKIATYLLSFLIALFGFIVLVSAVLSRTVSNPEFMVNLLENKNYYDAIFIEYCDEVEALAIPSGVPEGKFSSLVSKEQLKTDINNIIYAAYNDEGYAGDVFEYDEVYSKFYNCMLEVAAQNGLEADDELIVGIDNVAGVCASTYQVHIVLPFIDTLGSYATEYNTYFVKIIIAASVCFVLLFLLLIFVKKWRSVSKKIVSIALISDGFMLMIIPIIVLLSRKIRYIQIDTKSLYLFAVGYAEHLLYTLLVVGIVVLLLGVGLAAWHILKEKE